MEVLKSILGLLRHHPQDAEVGLIIATRDARAQLALLQNSTSLVKWELAIECERKLLDRLDATQSDMVTADAEVEGKVADAAQLAALSAEGNNRSRN
ncbi:MAG: hypothetical protein IH991_16250 [Planctomycetes bacterium]|nr:hypothetical protein [Planctomycetota bacterium]